jgi:hypothetical protein
MLTICYQMFSIIWRLFYAHFCCEVTHHLLSGDLLEFLCTFYLKDELVHMYIEYIRRDFTDRLYMFSAFFCYWILLLYVVVIHFLFFWIICTVIPLNYTECFYACRWYQQQYIFFHNAHVFVLVFLEYMISSIFLLFAFSRSFDCTHSMTHGLYIQCGIDPMSTRFFYHVSV